MVLHLFLSAKFTLILWEGCCSGDSFKDREKGEWYLWEDQRAHIALSFSLIHCQYVSLQYSQEHPAYQWSLVSLAWQGCQFLLWGFIWHLGSSYACEEGNFFYFLLYSSNTMEKKGWGEGRGNQWWCKGQQLLDMHTEVVTWIYIVLDFFIQDFYKIK